MSDDEPTPPTVRDRLTAARLSEERRPGGLPGLVRQGWRAEPDERVDRGKIPTTSVRRGSPAFGHDAGLRG
jgi:hypothetical protein